jgi:hypothetical protein
MANWSVLAGLGAMTPVERELEVRSGVPIRGVAPQTQTQWGVYCAALRMSTAVAVVTVLAVYLFLAHRINLLGGAALAVVVLWIAMRRTWMVWLTAAAMLLQQYLL